MQSGAPQALQRVVAVDAHVHFHRPFDRARFLDTAAANFRAAAARHGVRGPVPGFLLLTEAPGEQFFERCRALVGVDADGWTFHPTEEACSLRVTRDADELVLAAGRQIATREGLEVLAIGTLARPATDLSFEDAVAGALEEAGLAIVPWGFGKWTLRRGELVKRLLLRADPTRVFVGDNGGRPEIGPEPSLFGLARSRGVRILPGSDPLPFASQAGKVGRYGFLLDARLDRDQPVAALKRRLREPDAEPRPFGRRESLGGFIRAQAAMQIRKRIGRPA